MVVPDSLPDVVVTDSLLTGCETVVVVVDSVVLEVKVVVSDLVLLTVETVTETVVVVVTFDTVLDVAAVSFDTEAEVVVPIYPLAPAHDYDEAYSLLTDLYEGMCDRYGADAITIMGDSAGAGLAAGMAETFSHYKLEQPAHLVLISPIVDLSMRNPDIHDFFDRDPMLAPWGLAQLGDLWADGDDICDPRLSPIYGDVSDLKNVTIFTGTREIFYPDAIKFAEKLKDAGVTCDLRVGQGMNHDWPLYPIPEAKEAISQMVQVVVA